MVTAKGRLPIGDGPFRWDSSAPGVDRYRANTSTSITPKIQRIREAKFPSSKAIVGALARGEISLVEHIPYTDIPEFETNQDVKIGSYLTPSVHYLAVDGRTPNLRNRTLRRAISYAIDRKTILEENLLRRVADDVNSPADGPFNKESYANSPGVKPLDHELLLAKTHVVAAKKELETGVIRLTLEYPNTPEARLAVPLIAKSLHEVGVEIDLVERSQTELESSLRTGRRFDLAYRTFRCSEPVIEAGPILCPGYDAPASTNSLASLASPRILQILLQLEQLTDWTTARSVVLQIDKEARDELPIIPLWQLQDHYAWRTRLVGPSDASDRLYEGIETWEIAPWYARDPW